MSEDFFIKQNNGTYYVRFDPKNINGTAYVLHSNCAINYGQDKYTDNSANWLNCADWGNDIKISTVATNGKSSYYGTFDQNGNVWEWNDGTYFGVGSGDARKVLRGGGYGSTDVRYLARNYRSGPLSDVNDTDSLQSGKDTLIRAGFRVATISNPYNLDNFKYIPGDSTAGKDINGFGEVDYNYSINKYLVTNTEYAEFLNAIAATDTKGLFYTGSDDFYGITRSGSSGSYTYAVKTNMGNKPAVRISWFMAARYCNWLHNNKPTGAQNSSTTEDGAYDLTVSPYNVTNFSSLMDIDVLNLQRQTDAKYFIPSEFEWYKAAYYDPNRLDEYSTGITITDLNSTGSGIDGGVQARDPNWQIVAYPSSWPSAPESAPYSGYIYSGVPSVWTGQSYYTPNTIEFSRKWKDASWIGPRYDSLSLSSELSDPTANYNIIYATNFNASAGGSAYLLVYCLADNRSQVFVNGGIDTTIGDRPTITGGTQLYNTQFSDTNGARSGPIWSGQVPVNAGNNTLYVVATDIGGPGGGGYQGLLVSADPINYWNFATRSTQEAPCCVNTLSNGDGVGTRYNCLSGSTATVSITNASPAVVTLNSHGLNDNDEVYFTTTGSLPDGLFPYVRYYVKNAQTNTFEVTYKIGCPSINTSSNGTGTHTILYDGAPNVCDLGDPILTDFSLTQITCNSTPVTGINIAWTVKDIDGYNHIFNSPAATYTLCNYEYIKPSGAINILVGSGDSPQYKTAPVMMIRAVIRQPSSCYCSNPEIKIYYGKVSEMCSPTQILDAAVAAGYVWPRIVSNPPDFECPEIDYSDYLPPGNCDDNDCNRPIRIYAYCCGTQNSNTTPLCPADTDCDSYIFNCDSDISYNDCIGFNPGGTVVSVRDIAYSPISPNVAATQHIGASGSFAVVESGCLSYLRNGVYYSGSKLEFTENSYINLSFSIKLPNGRSSSWVPAGSVYVDEFGDLTVLTTGNIPVSHPDTVQ